VLPKSKNIGHTGGADCPGSSPPGTGGQPPQGECGLTLSNNSYYGVGDCEVNPSLCLQNMTVAAGGGKTLSWDQWQATCSDPGSQVFKMPTDDQLLSFAREALQMAPAPGPPPPPPTPLPPSPPPHYNNTCQGHCASQGHCCVGATAGCNQPSCAQGCLIAALVPLPQCVAACNAMKGKCSYSVKGHQFNECGG